MKKVLAVMAGPRRKHNTEFVFETFLEGVEKSGDVEINRVYLGNKKIGHCIGCNHCGKTGECFQKDDMVGLYDEFNNSDGIILASPIFFDGITSMGKAMIDRCQVYWSSKYILKKSSIDREKKRIGGLIVVGGAPDEEGKFLSPDQVGSMFFRAVNTTVKDRIFVANTDKLSTMDNDDLRKETYKKGLKFFDEF